MKDFKSLKGPARKVTWRHEYIYIYIYTPQKNPQTTLSLKKTYQLIKTKKTQTKKSYLFFLVITQHYCVVNQKAKVSGMSPLLLPAIPLPQFTKEIIL